MKLAMTLHAIWPSPSVNKVGVLYWVFEARYPACQCLCLRFDVHLAVYPAKLEVRMGRYSFPVRLFHSLQHAGLSRRTHRHQIPTRYVLHHMPQHCSESRWRCVRRHVAGRHGRQRGNLGKGHPKMARQPRVVRTQRLDRALISFLKMNLGAVPPSPARALQHEKWAK